MFSISLGRQHVRLRHLVVCCRQRFCLMFANIISFLSCFSCVLHFLFLKYFLHLCTLFHFSTSLSFDHSFSHAKKEAKTAHDRQCRRQMGQHLDCKCWRISLEIENSHSNRTTTWYDDRHDRDLEAFAEDWEDYVRMRQVLEDADRDYLWWNAGCSW